MICVAGSYSERSAGIGLAMRLAEDLVEIANQIEHAGSQVLERGKAGALEQSSRANGKPFLDLAEPGTMPPRVIARVMLLVLRCTDLPPTTAPPDTVSPIAVSPFEFG